MRDEAGELTVLDCPGHCESDDTRQIKETSYQLEIFRDTVYRTLHKTFPHIRTKFVHGSTFYALCSTIYEFQPCSGKLDTTSLLEYKTRKTIFYAKKLKIGFAIRLYSRPIQYYGSLISEIMLEWAYNAVGAEANMEDYVLYPVEQAKIFKSRSMDHVYFVFEMHACIMPKIINIDTIEPQ